MKNGIKIVDFYIFSNVHVALATFCLSEITLLVYGKSFNTFSFFVFFATLLSYNFIRFYRKTEIKSWLYDWMALHKISLYILSGISFLIIAWLGWRLRPDTIVALIPVAFLTLFYVVPFRGKLSLRTLAGLKLLLIAFCWAYVTVLLPVIDVETLWSNDILITFFQRFFFVAAITLPFDIRDLNFDNKSLKTIPQVFGIAKTKRIGLLFLMLFVGLNFFKENPSQFLRIEFIVMLAALFLLVRATPNQSKYYSAFFVEAIPIVWYLLLLV